MLKGGDVVVKVRARESAGVAGQTLRRAVRKAGRAGVIAAWVEVQVAVLAFDHVLHVQRLVKSLNLEGGGPQGRVGEHHVRDCDRKLWVMGGGLPLGLSSFRRIE